MWRRGGGKDHELFDDQLDPDDDDELLEGEELLLPLLENPDDDQLSHGVACHELAPRANSWSSRMNCVCDLAVITSRLDHGRRELAPMRRARSLNPKPEKYRNRNGAEHMRTNPTATRRPRPRRPARACIA